MSLENAILAAVRALPEDKQREVLELAVRLREPAPEPRPSRMLRGLCADLGPGPSKEEIDEVRGAMWRNFPRDGIA